MKILIETVPHMSQRYNTIGDWQWEGDTLHIKVSDMGDWRKEILVGLHEMIETLLCKKDGVTEEQVDEFDLAHPELHEPGESCLAPYHVQHMAAIDIEIRMARLLDVDLNKYEEQMEHMQSLRDVNENPTGQSKEENS